MQSSSNWFVKTIKQYSGLLWTRDINFVYRNNDVCRWSQGVSSRESRVDWISAPIEWWRECSLHNSCKTHPTTTTTTCQSHTPHRAKQGSVLHRYSIGCSFSYMQSQCLGKKKKITLLSVYVRPSEHPWNNKSHVLGLTVGTLLYYYKQDHHNIKKYPFTEVVMSFPMSVLIGPLPGVKGHSAWQTVQCITPSMHAALKAPLSSWRPFPGRVLLGCAWSPWSLPPMGRR